MRRCTKYLQLADKAARTVAMLTERLDHHRNRGQQQIVVQHTTTVNANHSKWAQTMFCAYGCSIDVRTFAWTMRHQAKLHAAIRMRDCSSSKSLRKAICIGQSVSGPICTMQLSMMPK